MLDVVRGVDLVEPLDGAVVELALVDRGQLAVAEHAAAGDPRVRDLVAVGGVDQVDDRVEHRHVLDAAEVDGDHVGGLPGLERSDLVVQSKRTRAVDCGHPQHGRAGHCCGAL